MRNLEEYAALCLRELDAIGIKYGNIVEFKVNTRAKKRFGQCKALLDGFSINISAVLLDERNSEQALKETIIHEILHTCRGCMNHGESWKRLAEKVGQAYGYNIKRTSSPDDKGLHEDTRPVAVRTVKYVLRCEDCGQLYPRAKLSKIIKYPYLYRCGRCGGRLKLVK